MDEATPRSTSYGETQGRGRVLANAIISALPGARHVPGSGPPPMMVEGPAPLIAGWPATAAVVNDVELSAGFGSFGVKIVDPCAHPDVFVVAKAHRVDYRAVLRRRAAWLVLLPETISNLQGHVHPLDVSMPVEWWLAKVTEFPLWKLQQDIAWTIHLLAERLGQPIPLGNVVVATIPPTVLAVGNGKT